MSSIKYPTIPQTCRHTTLWFIVDHNTCFTFLF